MSPVENLIGSFVTLLFIITVISYGRIVVYSYPVFRGKILQPVGEKIP
jgi:hypothetical protein